MEYRDHSLYLEDTPLADIARREGTPCYVYSRAAVLERFRDYHQAFADVPHKVCYAVKANSNLAILKLLAEAGAGFDIVSGGELFRVLQAGADPGTVIFSGVGKTSQELDYALEHNIRSFNCESEPELVLLDALASRRNVQARVALRVNPDVDASTHPYISTGLREHKFGIDIAEAEAVYQRARALGSLALEGVSCHIGSQIVDIAPMLQVFDKMIELVERLRAR
ncbi:MAG: alanine racemase, partial [Bryobacteraceae bacterium]